MKPETRRPKAERNLKPETPNLSWRDGQRRAHPYLISDFGFRPSFGLRPSGFGRPSAFGVRKAAGFTLIELLIVIAIIAILAAMVIPISGAVSRNKIRAKARVELERIATSIDLYKAKLGHYPPDNPGYPSTNQLYFELLGTTVANGVYTTLDGSAYVRSSSLLSVFGANPNGTARVGGIVNSSQGTGGDEGRVATSFLSGLKPDEVFTLSSGADLVKLLVAGVPAPTGRFSPIAYISSSPTNNPNTYDLWVDVFISGKTNRISNWTKETTIVP